jgi:1,4-dihydroxy-2-naphthoyl-CoA synthase
VSSSRQAEVLAGGKVTIDRPADAVARVTISNPDKRNALDHDILDAIAQAMPALDRGIETRCVIITGAGNVSIARSRPSRRSRSRRSPRSTVTRSAAGSS